VQLRAALAGLDQASTRKQSMELLRRRLAQDPGDREARLALGDAYLRNGESERALKVFREERSDTQVWRGEVAALITLGRYDEALRAGAEIVPASCK
jgi:thioredoxin-like negative regulator of GroEL